MCRQFLITPGTQSQLFAEFLALLGVRMLT